MALKSFSIYIDAGGIGFVSAFGRNYLAIGRVIGLGALVALGNYLFFSNNSYYRLLSLTIFVFLLWLLTITGGRGPLICTIIPVLVLLLNTVRVLSNGRVMIRKHGIGLIFILLIGLVIFYYQFYLAM